MRLETRLTIDKYFTYTSILIVYVKLVTRTTTSVSSPCVLAFATAALTHQTLFTFVDICNRAKSNHKITELVNEYV